MNPNMNIVFDDKSQVEKGILGQNETANEFHLKIGHRSDAIDVTMDVLGVIHKTD